MTRNIKACFIFLMAVALVLAGCSSSGNSEGENASGNKNSEAAAGSDDGSPVMLSWFSDVSGWNPPSPWSLDSKTVEGVITEKTGVSFQFDIPAQDGGTKLSLMLVSNKDLPDIMTITDDTLMKKLIDAGKVWDLDEFLKQYSSDSHLLNGSFPEDIKTALIERDGGWYAFPSHMDSLDAREIYPPSSDFYADAANFRDNGSIMFNEQIMEQAGITVDDLKTEAGVLAAMEKVKGLKVNGVPVTPLRIDGKNYNSITIGNPGHGGTTLGVLQRMFGAMAVDKDGNYRDIILADESKDAIAFLFKAANAGYFDPSQMTTDDSKESIKSGAVFAFIGNSANTGFADEDSPSTWVTPGPVISNKGATPVHGKSLKAGTGWMNTVIAKTAKNPERIAKFLNYMTSDEGLLLNYYGFEGEGYTLDANGLAIQTKADAEQAAEFSKIGVFAFWPFHNIAWHDHATVAPTDIRGVDSIMAMQVQTTLGKESQLYDLSPLAMPSNFIEAGSSLDNAKLEIKAYLESQISKMVLAKDEAAFNQLYDDMIAQVKKMGIDDINAKINEQFHKQEEVYGITLKGINS
ncbi:extracellular solute-binding protein [Paenibacillus sp. CAU 1782]